MLLCNMMVWMKHDLSFMLQRISQIILRVLSVNFLWNAPFQIKLQELSSKLFVIVFADMIFYLSKEEEEVIENDPAFVEYKTPIEAAHPPHK